MEVILYVLIRALLVLFAVGVVGCLVVIPATAIQLFKVLFEPDTDEETAANTAARLRRVP